MNDACRTKVRRSEGGRESGKGRREGGRKGEREGEEGVPLLLWRCRHTGCNSHGPIVSEHASLPPSLLASPPHRSPSSGSPSIARAPTCPVLPGIWRAAARPQCSSSICSAPAGRRKMCIYRYENGYETYAVIDTTRPVASPRILLLPAPHMHAHGPKNKEEGREPAQGERKVCSP
jgi:hypothetical protein